MAAKRKSSASKAKSQVRRKTKQAAKKVAWQFQWRWGVTLPVFLLLLVFASAFAYGAYLESGGNEKEPQIVTENFINLDADLSVHYIDVGQGDCSLVVYGDNTVLIDAGERDYGEAVVDYIRSLGIEQLDYIIATHPHSDHIGGLTDVINEFEAGTVIAPKVSDELVPTGTVYEDFLKALSKKGLMLTAAEAGTVYDLSKPEKEGDNTSFEILGPIRSDYEDLNDWSVVIRLVHGENSFVFTGDAGTAAEEDIMLLPKDISADVLKVGHHGSSTANSKLFLMRVAPKAAVIPCGNDNSYGHPHKEVIDRLKLLGTEIYRTDAYGTVVVYSDGEDIRIRTEKESS